MEFNIFLFICLFLVSMAHTFICKQDKQIHKLQSEVIKLNNKMDMLEKH